MKDMNRDNYRKRKERVCGVNRGMTLVELLISLAVLITTIFMLSGSLVQMGKVFTIARNERRVTNIAESTLERIVREVRLACGATVDAGPPQSIILLSYQDFDPSVLTEGCTTVSGQKIQKTVTLSSNRVALNVGTAPTQYISPSTSFVKVTSLQIQKLQTNGNSEALRIGISAEAGQGAYKASKTYYATAVLWNSY